MDLETNELVGGQKLTTHAKGKCVGQFCTIHNHSDHHMIAWPQNWRSDRGIMERMCPHGIGHPDPDDPKTQDRYEAVHGCDGCCSPKKQFEQDFVELIHTYDMKKK